MTRTDHGGQRRRQETGRQWARALAVAIAAVVLRAGVPVGKRPQRVDGQLHGPAGARVEPDLDRHRCLTFAFGEGGSKRLVAGIVFGVGMAIGAVNFMGWLFP
jgi:hypothetical protein